MNKVLLVGRIANDVALYTTNSNISYARTSVAVTRSGANNNDTTDFIPIVAWRNTAEYIANYAPKGSLVSVEGSFLVSEYNGQNGRVRRYEVLVDRINCLEPISVRQNRTQNTGAYNVNNNYSQTNVGNASYAPRANQQANYNTTNQASASFANKFANNPKMQKNIADSNQTKAANTSLHNFSLGDEDDDINQ